MNYWGLDELEVLLTHYGQRKASTTRMVDPLVDADGARGEFLMFKRLFDQNKHATNPDANQFNHPDELYKVIFCGANQQNRTIFRGNSLCNSFVA